MRRLGLAEQLAEAAAEIDLLLRAEHLVPDHQDPVALAQRAVDCRELLVREWTGDIQSRDFGSKGRAQAAHLHDSRG